jgi:hypothetical protein
LGLVFAVAALGCVATATTPPPRGVTVNGPPPAPLADERQAPPGPGAIWIAGYWHWTGIEYAWIPGHWEGKPPPGATWQAPRYVRAGDAYYYEPGAWQPASRPAQEPSRANALR